jgi:hypothetical protein
VTPDKSGDDRTVATDGAFALARFNKRIDVAVAEFNALRSEMHNRINAQAALVGVALAALGVVFGFVVKDHGETRLLLAVPPLALLVSLLSAAESHRVATIGDYVREVLWPYLTCELDDKLPSWEDGIGERRRGHQVVFRAIFLDGPATALFALAAAGAQLLAKNRDPSFENIDETLWWVNWLVLFAALAAPILMGLVIKRNSERAAELRRERVAAGDRDPTSTGSPAAARPTG